MLATCKLCFLRSCVLPVVYIFSYLYYLCHWDGFKVDAEACPVDEVECVECPEVGCADTGMFGQVCIPWRVLSPPRHCWLLLRPSSPGLVQSWTTGALPSCWLGSANAALFCYFIHRDVILGDSCQAYSGTSSWSPFT